MNLMLAVCVSSRQVGMEGNKRNTVCVATSCLKANKYYLILLSPSRTKLDFQTRNLFACTKQFLEYHPTSNLKICHPPFKITAYLASAIYSSSAYIDDSRSIIITQCARIIPATRSESNLDQKQQLIFLGTHYLDLKEAPRYSPKSLTIMHILTGSVVSQHYLHRAFIS